MGRVEGRGLVMRLGMVVLECSNRFDDGTKKLVKGVNLRR